MSEGCVELSLASAGGLGAVWRRMVASFATSFSWWSRTALALLIAFCIASPALAADSPAAISGLRVGFAGTYRVGCWTPVEVEFSGGEQDLQGRLELTVPDGDGLASVVSSDEITLPAGKTLRTLVYVKFGRLESPLKAAFVAGEKTLFSRTFVAGAEGSPFRRSP